MSPDVDRRGDVLGDYADSHVLPRGPRQGVPPPESRTRCCRGAFGIDFDNAFWDGERLVLGDGDGEIFGRFSASLEVVAHELSHALTQEAGLGFNGEQGALNESIADVLGLMVKQYALRKSVDEADWLIAEKLLLPDVPGQALRSMRAPGTAYDDPRIGRDTQVSRMSRYVGNERGYANVYINSGIPDHAFYLLATSLGGYAWEKAGVIWYRALTSEAITPTMSSQSFAGLTLEIARRDNADDPSVAGAVEAAWRSVGVVPLAPERSRTASPSFYRIIQPGPDCRQEPGLRRD